MPGFADFMPFRSHRPTLADDLRSRQAKPLAPVRYPVSRGAALKINLIDALPAMPHQEAANVLADVFGFMVESGNWTQEQAEIVANKAGRAVHHAGRNMAQIAREGQR